VVVDSFGLSCLIPVIVTPIPEPSKSKLIKAQNDVLNNNSIEEMIISNKNVSVAENVQNYTDSSCQTDSELYGNKNDNGNNYCQDVIEKNDVKIEDGRDDETAVCLDENETKVFSEKQTIVRKNEDKNVTKGGKKNDIENEDKIVNDEGNKNAENVKEKISFEYQHYITPPYSPSSLFIVPSYPITNYNDEKHGVSLSDIRHLISLSPFLSPEIASTHDSNKINKIDTINEIIGSENNDIPNDRNSSEQSNNNSNDDDNNNINNKNDVVDNNNNDNSSSRNNSNHSNNVTPHTTKNQHQNQKIIEEIYLSPPSSTDYYIKKKLYSKNKTSTSKLQNMYGPYSINNLLSNQPVMSMSSSFWKKRLSFVRQSFYNENNF
jgi:hypothetical protein